MASQPGAYVGRHGLAQLVDADEVVVAFRGRHGQEVAIPADGERGQHGSRVHGRRGRGIPGDARRPAEEHQDLAG